MATSQHEYRIAKMSVAQIIVTIATTVMAEKTALTSGTVVGMTLVEPLG